MASSLKVRAPRGRHDVRDRVRSLTITNDTEAGQRQLASLYLWLIGERNDPSLDEWADRVAAEQEASDA